MLIALKLVCMICAHLIEVCVHDCAHFIEVCVHDCAHFIEVHVCVLLSLKFVCMCLFH